MASGAFQVGFDLTHSLNGRNGGAEAGHATMPGLRCAYLRQEGPQNVLAAVPAISGYAGMKRAPAEKWHALHDAGESWSAIGRQYEVSHTAVRSAVQTYRRYLADREYLAEHGPDEVPEKRA